MKHFYQAGCELIENVTFHGGDEELIENVTFHGGDEELIENVTFLIAAMERHILDQFTARLIKVFHR